MTTGWNEYEKLLKKQLHETYTETVVEHAVNPRHVGSLTDADGNASLLGSCGDNMEMWLKIEHDRITEITFWTDGCEATIACGSITTELAEGKTVGEAMAINAGIIMEKLGGLPPDHVHCAGLAASTLRKALVDYLHIARQPWKKPYRKTSRD